MRHIDQFVILALLVLFGCSRKPSQEADLKQPIPSLSGTDSLVVEQLVGNSQNHFKEGGAVSDLFDNFLKEAENIALKSNNKYQLARIYNIVGKRYRNRSLFGQAMGYHQKALDWASQAGDKRLLAQVYNQIGVVYRRIDDNPMALEMHTKALNLAEQVKDTATFSAALNSIGNVNFNMGRYHTSIEYYINSLELAQTMNNLLGLAINHNNIGESLLKLNEVDSALNCFFTSLKYNRMIHSRMGESICFISIGAAYIILDKPQQALGYLSEALTISLDLGDRMQEAITYIKIGETYLDMGTLTRATEYLQKGYNLALQIGSKNQIEESVRLLGDLAQKRGNFKEALDYFKMATAYRDSTINEKNMHHLATMEAVFVSDRQVNRIQELNQKTLEQRLLLKQQKWILSGVLVVFAVLALVVLLGIRQYRLQGRYRNLKHQQRLLRSQMNPHFIFNALSAIQVFVLENDVEKSSRFLSDFANLMRQVLRSSNQDYISLDEEKKILQYYMELQRLRFLTPFEFSIHVDEALNADWVMIPPMITQPFIENAIEHGVRPLGGDGWVKVSFLKSSQQMIVEVEDNGVGIEASRKARDKGWGHESMAINITRERLEVIRKDSGGKVGLEILDKKQVNPFDKGTLVRIIFPLVEFSSQKQ
jgi:tetratricopeptide (TPR) repeat protein